jgi:hypothetical protein
MRRLSTESYVKRAHPQRDNVIANHKIASAEDDRLEADLRSVSNDVDAIARHEVFILSSVRTTPVLVRHHVIFFTALVPQLQLCHRHWLVSIQSVGDLHSRVLCYTSCLTETMLQSSKHICIWMNLIRIT